MKWKGATLVRQKQYRELADNPATAKLFAQLQSASSQIADHIRDASQANWKTKLEDLRDEREQLEKQLALKSAQFRKMKNTQCANA